MEHFPGVPFESLPAAPERGKDSEDKEKKDKKKRRSPEYLPLADKKADKKKEVGGDIGRSIFERTAKTHEAKAEPLDKLKFARERQTVLKSELEAPKPAGEAAAPAERLSDEETKTVNKVLAAERLEAVAGEGTAAEAAEESKRAAEDFLEAVAEEGDVDTAFAATAEKYGMTTEEIDELLADTEDEPADEPEEPAEAEPIIDPRELTEGEVPLHAEDDEEVPPSPAPAAGSGAGGSSGSSGSSTGSGSGSAGAAPPPGGLPPFGSAAAAGPGSYAYPSSPDMRSSADAAYYERRAQNRGLLVGGIIGYLIGRRRGRIRTEKRLLPVQQKLERQVKGLEWQLQDRETKLRVLAAERRRTAEVSRVRPLRGMAVPERIKPAAAESRLGLTKPAPAERLGRMVVTAEVPKQLKNVRPETVKGMKHGELLELSEKIVVEGASLRQIYEAHLVGEHQLRHLVTEYLRGRDIRRDLKHEMIEREIDFERDPILRDRARSSVSGSGNQALNRLLEKAGVLQEEDTDAAEIQARAAFEAKEASKQARQRRVVDLSLVGSIAVLFALVLYLLFSR